MFTPEDKKKDVGIKTAVDQQVSNEKHSEPEKKQKKAEQKEKTSETDDIDDEATPAAPTGTKSNFDEEDEALLKRAGSQSQGRSEAIVHDMKM